MNALAPIGFATAYRQLSPVERQFVDAWMHQGEQAARKNGTPITALLDAPITPEMIEASNGLILRPMVQAAIGERVKDLASASDITMNMILRELRAIAFSNIDDYTQIDAMGNPVLDYTKATPEQRGAIQSMKTEYKMRGGHTVEYKMYDKQRALETLIDLVKDRDREWIESAKPPSLLDVLPSSASPDAAADLYARMISG